MSGLLAALLLSEAAATGLPPWEAVEVVDAACQRVDGPVTELTVTWARYLGVCAPPGPEGDSCSTWVDAPLDARDLVVRRRGCEEPLPGRWVEDGRCGELPRWRWSGRLDAGLPHGVGRDFSWDVITFEVAGAPTASACPALSPREGAVRTETVATRAGSPQWIAFPAEGYAVVGEGADARLRWTPGPTLQQWVLNNPGAVLESEPMEAAAARALLDGALREPSGLAVRHEVSEHREWFEGWRQRGVPRCERLMELDLQQQLRAADPAGPLGPPLRGTVRLREPADAERCFGPNPAGG